MFLHYITIALRNLAKYKAQTVISVVSLAVGMTVLAVIQCLLFLIRKPAVYSEPYADRCYTIWLKNEKDGIGKTYNFTSTHADLLSNGGGMSCVERLFPKNGSFESGYVNFLLDDGSYRRKPLDYELVKNDYPNYRGLRSAITGRKVPVLHKNEVLLSQSMARKVFADRNPIGATLSFQFRNEERDYVLADVFEDVPLTESEDHHLLLSFYDDDNFDWNAAWIPYVEVMLKEGCTPEQLKAEADARLEPCGLTVEVKSLKGSGNSISDVTRGIIWLAGSLILLSALISFLRMQVQLIRMRGREFALRRVNGASASKLFLMLFVEYAITVLLCTLLSLVMTKLLIGFADSRLAGYLSEYNWKWNGIYRTILTIGAAMLAICTVIIAIWVKTTVRSGYTLMDNIRDSGGLMRKIMLAIQTVISMVFISGTLSLLQFVAGESKLYNIPDNERFFKQCILVQSYMINDRAALHRELQNSRLAQQVIPYSEDFRKRHNDLDDPVGKLLDDMRMQYIRNYHLPDTSLFGFYGMHIGWKRMPEPGESYVLLSEGYSDLYTQSGEPIPDMSSTSDGRMLPVLGTYTAKPYSRLVSERIGIAVITPGEDRIYDYYIMVPKKGQYQALLSDVQEVVSNLSPELVDPNVFNFRDKIGGEVIMLDAMRGGSLILSGICLIVCAMSLYSTLLMSIRARRKEVAIRKVNGARKSDVAMMFGRLYITLAVVSILISAPIAILFNNAVIQMSEGDLTASDISPWLSVAGGIIFMLIVITLTVWSSIKGIMKLNPVEYIETE